MPQRYQTDIELPKIYAINLAERTDRRQFMDVQLSKLGMAYEFVDGIPGKLLPDEELAQHYDEERAVKEGKGAMTRGEIGCALSHLQACKRMIDENRGLAVVVEDDVLIGLEFIRAVEGVVRHLDKSQPHVVLLHNVARYYVGGQKISPLHKMQRMAAATYASAYVITRPAAKALVENLYPVWYVADRWASFAKKGFVEVYAVVPYVVGHASLSFDSSLISERVAVRRKEQQEGHRAREKGSLQRLKRRLIKQISRFLRGIRRQPQTW